jgi:hypothetical protein
LPPGEVGFGQLAEIVDALVAGILNDVRSALRQAVELWNGGVPIILVHTDCSVVLRRGENLRYRVTHNHLKEFCKVSGRLLLLIFDVPPIG